MAEDIGFVHYLSHKGHSVSSYQLSLNKTLFRCGLNLFQCTFKNCHAEFQTYLQFKLHYKFKHNGELFSVSNFVFQTAYVLFKKFQ